MYVDDYCDGNDEHEEFNESDNDVDMNVATA